MVLRTKIAAGDRFDNLVVLEVLDKFYVEPNKHRRVMVLVKCDCDNQFEIRAQYLYTGGQKCTECQFLQNSTVSIGRVYDKLTVIGFTKVKGKKAAVCQCICGNIVNRRPELLTRINITNNCGCLPRGGWKGVGAVSQTVFHKIKQNAAARDLLVEVDIHFIADLYEKQNGLCAITKLPIPFGKRAIDSNDASLDRIDSSKGYTKENVWWVHKDVNKMKMEFSQNRFIEICKLVAKHN